MSYRGKDARIQRKNQSWIEILIPSHDKMAAVDSFDTKKVFFFFSRSAVEGEGQRYHALCKSAAAAVHRGRCRSSTNSDRSESQRGVYAGT